MYDNNDLMTGFALGKDSGGNGNGNGGGFGWGGAWEGIWGIIILAMVFGWGNGGWGNGFGGGNNGANAFLPYAVGANGALTRADLCQDMNFQGLENGVRGIQQGICDSTFALNNTIVNGFNGVSSAICNLGYEQAQLNNATNVAIMQGNNALSTQLAQCLKKISKKAKEIFCTDKFYAVGTCAA